jgi:hypothetical protein
MKIVNSKAISFGVITSEVASANECNVFKNHSTVP